MPDLKVSDLCRELRISEDKARELIARGDVKAYKLGPRMTRVTRAEVDRLRGLGSDGDR